MTAQILAGSTFVPLTLPFGVTNISDASGTLNTDQGGSNQQYRMPADGSVIGYSVQLNGTLDTGTLSFVPTKNASPMTGSFSGSALTINTLGTDQRVAAQQGAFNFKKGDYVGLAYSKSGTISPTTLDAAALLIVLLEGYDY